MKKILTIIFVVAALQLALVSIASADGRGNLNNSYYRVRSGDTLFSIGRQFGVSAYRIADANGLRNPNNIYAGQILYIPSGGFDDCFNRGCRDNGNQGFHRVRYGETLYSIGRQYDVHPNHIAQVNNLYNPNYIYAGQRLRIPSGSSYPWGGCGGSGSGCNRYGSGDRYCGGCGDYGCGGSGCGGYDYGCGGYGSGCDNVDPDFGVPAPGYGYGCNNNCGGWSNRCNDRCGGWGYDYTGYYYNRGDQRYSFTCGQNFNCW